MEKKNGNLTEHSNKKYVYSAEQANYYIQHGIVPLQVGRGTKGDVYFVFNYFEHNKIYPAWLAEIESWKK